jgi:shikimate dehydrogenase
MRETGGRRIEMIGTPIDHVRTPDLLNRLFEREGQALRVVKKRLGPVALGRHVEALRRSGDVAGLVVTTPLKSGICAHLDRRTPLVRLLGAANCIRFDGDSWIGANFDGHGFEAAVRAAGLELAGRRFLLAGSGGAGTAIAARIVGAGAAALTIIDSDSGKVTDFLQALRRLARGCVLGDAVAGKARYDILVNATPLGMNRGDPSPFAPGIVRDAGAVVDIVIAEQPSPLRRDAERFGRTFVEGTAMVRGQVELFRRFLTTSATSEAALSRAAAKASGRGAPG